MTTKYRAVEFVRGYWHIVDQETGQPVYDKKPFGNDKPVVVTSENVSDVLEEMNNKWDDETQ